MCLLALFFRVVEDCPVVVGANREELYARGGEPPHVLGESLLFVAGIDPVAGGTWLGVNERGVLIAVTNRPKTVVPREPRSRGLLARDLLACPSAAAAADHAAKELGGPHYAGCNVLCVDAKTAIVLHAGDWLRVRPLPSGLHVLTSRDVNDPSDPRVVYALDWLGQRHYAVADDCVNALRELCGQTATPPMCLHGDKGGTVSSSIVVLRAPLADSTYLHAQGPPDRTPYFDVSHLLRSLFVKK
jgi:uncharacterized protein with NRDE domain